jgi:hypothetical protein
MQNLGCFPVNPDRFMNTEQIEFIEFQNNPSRKRSFCSISSDENPSEECVNEYRRVWTEEEDQAIEYLVAKYGVKSWASIAEKIDTFHNIKGRTGKQCRERWHNHLDPNIKKTTWSIGEELILLQAHAELGNKWSEISKRLPGRTDNHVKNQWYSFVRRNLRRSLRESSRDTGVKTSPKQESKIPRKSTVKEQTVRRTTFDFDSSHRRVPEASSSTIAETLLPNSSYLMAMPLPLLPGFLNDIPAYSAI